MKNRITTKEQRNEAFLMIYLRCLVSWLFKIKHIQADSTESHRIQVDQGGFYFMQKNGPSLLRHDTAIATERGQVLAGAVVRAARAGAPSGRTHSGTDVTGDRWTTIPGKICGKFGVNLWLDSGLIYRAFVVIRAYSGLFFYLCKYQLFFNRRWTQMNADEIQNDAPWAARDANLGESNLVQASPTLNNET